jgi:hypothetical protein
MYREKAIAVSPALHRHEAGSAAKFLEFGDPLFARILGVDGFTRAQFEPLPAYCHALRFETHQMHFDAPVLRAVKRAVTKRSEIEIGTERTIDMAQYVEIDLSGFIANELSAFVLLRANELSALGIVKLKDRGFNGG